MIMMRKNTKTRKKYVVELNLVVAVPSYLLAGGFAWLTQLRFANEPSLISPWGLTSTWVFFGESKEADRQSKKKKKMLLFIVITQILFEVASVRTSSIKFQIKHTELATVTNPCGKRAAERAFFYLIIKLNLCGTVWKKTVWAEVVSLPVPLSRWHLFEYSLHISLKIESLLNQFNPDCPLTDLHNKK